MRRAALRREAAAVIAAKPMSALLHDTVEWYLVWVWSCGCGFCGGMGDAMDNKNTVKVFLTQFFSIGKSSRKS